MKYISICSGICAPTAAWKPLGWEPVAFSEIEPFPSRVLKHHYPDVPNHGDFTALDWSIYRGKVDLVVAGTPCQAFSVAGHRKSLNDARGNLTLEFIHVIDSIRPRYVVWENVPGVLSTGDNAFGCFLGALVGGDDPVVFKQGWPSAGVVDGPTRSACWRTLDAQYFGLAQRRKRVFVIASPRGKRHPAEILLEWESLRRDYPPSRQAGEGACWVFPCLTRRGAGSLREEEGYVVEQGGIRHLTPLENERLQGFPDNFTLIPNLRKRKKAKRNDQRLNDFLVDAADGPRYKALGNSMAVPVLRWIAEMLQA